MMKQVTVQAVGSGVCLSERVYYRPMHGQCAGYFESEFLRRALCVGIVYLVSPSFLQFFLLYDSLAYS